MGGRGRAKPVSNGHDDPARQVVISEWDRWASQHLSTGYKASRDDGMSFFCYMQMVCPQLLPAVALTHGRLCMDGCCWSGESPPAPAQSCPQGRTENEGICGLLPRPAFSSASGSVVDRGRT